MISWFRQRSRCKSQKKTRHACNAGSLPRARTVRPRPKADAILHDKGVFLIPDILANAGGVVVSYFEWVQDLQNFFWNEAEVNNKLREILLKAFQEVLAMSQKQSVNMRLAALMIGIDRVARAMLWRGFYA